MDCKTLDFGSVCLGSNPGGTTKAAICSIAAFAILWVSATYKNSGLRFCRKNVEKIVL